MYMHMYIVITTRSSVHHADRQNCDTIVNVVVHRRGGSWPSMIEQKEEQDPQPNWTIQLPLRVPQVLIGTDT